jgi:hypothetical protein
MQAIIFTLCSNNYLAQAKCLGDSVAKIHPNCQFIIGLVDVIDKEVDYDFFNNMEILPFDQLGYPEFDDMLSRYNVIEFNTSVKPYYIDFIWKKYGRDYSVIYLDPDIFLYRKMEHVYKALETHSVVLTPMFCEAPKETSLDELVALRHGMYNLGFIALKYSDESIKLINWWKERLRTHCLIDKAKGIFVDQKWIDLVPMLFDEVFILKHRGYNMAWWNFSERKLIDLGDDFAVNSNDQLLYFFHFSGFKIDSDFITGRSGESQFSYAVRPELKRLGNEYRELLIKNNFLKLNLLKPQLNFFEIKEKRFQKIKNKLKKILKRIS